MQVLFLVIYLLNIQQGFALTYDTILIFSLFRYLNVEYPENLELFFKATDAFTISFQLVKMGNEDQELQNKHSVTFLGATHKIFNQTPRPRFQKYAKTNSFL